MARKRSSKKLTELLSRPSADTSIFERIFLWIFRSDASCALTIGILFIASTVLGQILPTAMLNLQRSLTAVMALLIFGVFLGVIVVTETEKHYKGTGSRIRIITGAIGFCFRCFTGFFKDCNRHFLRFYEKSSRRNIRDDRLVLIFCRIQSRKL